MGSARGKLLTQSPAAQYPCGVLDLTPHICLVAGTGEGSSGSGDSCAVQGAEPSACGCRHLLRPALSISLHLPSASLSWAAQVGFGVLDAVWMFPGAGTAVSAAWNGGCPMQGFQPGLLSALGSSKATLQCQGGEVLSLQEPDPKPALPSLCLVQRCQREPQLCWSTLFFRGRC